MIGQDNINKIFFSGNYIMVSKPLIQLIGLTAAAVYSVLFQMNVYASKNNKLDSDGCFTCTLNKLEKETGLGRTAQNKAIQTLIKCGLIIEHSGVGEDNRNGRHFRVELGGAIALKQLYPNMFKEGKGKGVVAKSYPGPKVKENTKTVHEEDLTPVDRSTKKDLEELRKKHPDHFF